MDIVFLFAALIAILFGIALMILYRPGKRWEKPWVGICSSPVLGGVIILLHDFIPSIVGWILLGLPVVLFWVSFYDMFFGKKKMVS